jgi:DNA primase
MPGIDYPRLRQQLPLAQVLDLLGFTATARRGAEVRGPCPVHSSSRLRSRPRSRSFAAHLQKHCWRCFGCGAGGNALDLYLAVTKLPLYEAALELCARLHLAVPWLPRAASRSPP